MVVRLFPTIKLEVQFLDLLQALRQRHAAEINSRKILPSSSTLTNGRPPTHHLPAHVIPSSSFEHSSNSNSPSTMNGHHQSKLIYSERSQIPKAPALPLRALKHEPKYFLNQYEKKNNQKFFLKKIFFISFSAQTNETQNLDSNENDTKHTFPHVYKLPQFPETLRLALASQDASAFKLRTYYRNILISSIYDDLTRTYNLW
jgi:hypothetical protein